MLHTNSIVPKLFFLLLVSGSHIAAPRQLTEQEELEVVKKQRDQIQKELTLKEQELIKKQQDYNLVFADNNELLARNNRLMNELDRLIAENKRLKGDNNELDKQFDDLLGANKTTLNERKKLENEIAELKTQVYYLKQQLASAHSHVHDHNDHAENQRLKADRLSIDRFFPTLRLKEGRALEKALEHECEKLAKAERDLLNLRANLPSPFYIQELRNTIKDLHGKLKEHAEREKSLQREAATFREAVSDSKETITFLKKEIVRKNRALDNGGIDYRENDRLHEENMAVRREMSVLNKKNKAEIAAAQRDRDEKVAAAESKNVGFAFGGLVIGAILVAILPKASNVRRY